MAITKEEALLMDARTLVTRYRDRYVHSMVSKTKEGEQECLDDARVLEDVLIERLEAGARAMEATSDAKPGQNQSSFAEEGL